MAGPVSLMLRRQPIGHLAGTPVNRPQIGHPCSRWKIVPLGRYLRSWTSTHHQGPRPTTRSTTRSSNMKPPTRLASQALPRLFVSSRSPCVAFQPIASRALHYSAADPANVAPFCATGPPPEPPQPAAEHPYAKVERRRKQAELLKSAKELREASSGKSTGKSPLKKRFWQDVHIKEVDGAHTDYYTLHPAPSSSSTQT